jgi:folate-dependent tRNA-U54 methylase TrmFO/GidA
MVGAFNVRLASSALETDMVGLLNQNSQSAGEVICENALSHRVFAGDADGGDWPQFTVQVANHSGSMTTGNAADQPACSLAEMGATSSDLALA